MVAIEAEIAEMVADEAREVGKGQVMKTLLC